jgi:hypothetical protein
MFYIIQLSNSENSDSDVLEEMLFQFSKLLHPNHYILIDIMHNLVSWRVLINKKHFLNWQTISLQDNSLYFLLS